MIWLSRVAMIFSYLILDIWSILILKTQKYNKVPRWYEIPIQSHMLFFIAKSSTYATCYLIEFWQIVMTLSEIHFILPWSRSHTRFHHMLCFYTRSKQISIHKIKLQVYVWHLSLKNMSRIWGYKKIKDAYPKKVCHMLRHVKKKKKRCIPKEGMPHA